MPPNRWHNCHNFVGFLPEVDITCSETWLEGATSLVDDMRYYADEDDEEAFADAGAEAMTLAQENEWLASDEAPSMRAHVDAVRKDDPPQDGRKVGYFIEDHRLRLVAFWLVKSSCQCDPS